MATVYDIARAARTSPATVSRVLNGRTNVNPATARRIREAMEATNFQPRWKAAERNRFLVLVPSAPGILNSGYVSRILSGMADASFKLGYNLLLRPFDTAHCDYREMRQILLQESAAGCCLISLNEQYLPTPDIDAMGLPHVVIGHKTRDDGRCQILFDDYQAGLDATNYLLSLGHRRIALITFTLTDRGHRDVHRGFIEAMTKANCRKQAQHLQFGEDLAQAGRAAALRLLQPRVRPTAVLISNEVMAAGFLAETRAMKLDVPNDVSVIAFENAAAFDLTTPPLTVMQTPVNNAGAEAVKLLCAQIDGTADNSGPVLLPIPMFVRHSTRAAALDS